MGLRESIKASGHPFVGHFCYSSPSESTSLFVVRLPRTTKPSSDMAGTASSVLIGVLAALLLADLAVGQTFSYSRGWKSGKRAGGGVAGAALPLGVAARAAAVGDDIAVEDLPLYRYILESRGEHRVPYDPWRLVEDPVLHYLRRPALGAMPLAHSNDQASEHEDR